jgi:hypothetical protein
MGTYVDFREHPAKEDVMTKPSSGTDREALSQPEVKPEVIKDLDVTGDDADDIVGGCLHNTLDGPVVTAN